MQSRTTSTTRWSSRRRPAPARRPSSSTASSGCSRRGRATMIEIVAVTFTEKAAGELKLRLRERLEEERAKAADAAVARAPRGGARDARGSARQHDPRVLRRSAARAAGRSARRSAVRRAHRAAGRSAVRSRVPRLAAGGARAARRRAFGARLRRTSAPSFGGGGNADGPIDRLRNAGRSLAEWRDFPAPWRRPSFDRERRNRSADRRASSLAELTRRRLVDARQPVHRHRRRAPAQPSDHARGSRSASATTTAGKRGWSIWSATAASREHERAAATSYGKDVTRSDVLAARDALLAGLQQFKQEADADLAALPAAGACVARRTGIRRSRPRPARSTSPTCWRRRAI